ncbi:MAG: acetyl-CoA hydrolase/transferase family protein [Ignavibacteria bacterium]|jgi:4-hydroxybutyrate CoA-transferase
MQLTSAFEALANLHSHDRVFIHSVAAAPQCLINGMMEHAHRLETVEIVQLHTEGPAPYADPEMSPHFTVNTFFVGENIRDAVSEGRAEYMPVFLSEVPQLFKKGILPVKVALIQVSPPDIHGYCSLGISVDITKSVIQHAEIIIAQINEHMPRTHGDGIIHIDSIDFGVIHNTPLPEYFVSPHSDIHDTIGNNVASLIEDGATLQMGIGAIPDAVLSALKHHRYLGIHTEMFSDGVIPLVEKGVIDGSKKVVHPGKIVTGFVMGSKKLYDFVNDNPSVVFLDIAYVNDTNVIRRNPHVVAINSAIEIDITGQICADSIGRHIYSGVGGQMDFIRGASLSENGKPIIAMPSITANGESKIVTTLKQGAGIVTTRAHAHYIVTEYGIADVYGKNIKQRCKALIDIAHPVHREMLEKSSYLL